MLDRSVLRMITKKGTDKSPRYGEDAGLLPLTQDTTEYQKTDDRIAVQVNPVEGWTYAPRRAVYGALNSLAAAGAKAEAIAVTILMPPEVKEKQLKALMRELNELCVKENITLIAGHTAYSTGVNTLIMSVTGIGYGKKMQDGTRLTGGLDLVMTGFAGSEGAAVIAKENEGQLKNRFMESFVKKAQELYDEPSMAQAAKDLYEGGAAYVHDLREGGIFAGLWEMASAGNIGLDIHLKDIPIKQHTIEVCEFFNLNPYMLYSGGCLIAAVKSGSDATAMMAERGIPCTVIGHTTDGHDRIVRYDDETRFLEPPKPDEYFKTIT